MGRGKVKINRRFTHAGASPYQGITFEKRLSEIRNPDGKVIFRQEDVQVPSFTACAHKCEGVFETLNMITRMLLHKFINESARKTA